MERERKQYRYKKEQIVLTKTKHIFIANRYYYWAEIKRIRFDDVLKLIETEAFIQERTILNVIKKYEYIINDLIKKEVTPRQLAKKYPSFNWRK